MGGWGVVNFTPGGSNMRIFADLNFFLKKNPKPKKVKLMLKFKSEKIFKIEIKIAENK